VVEEVRMPQNSMGDSEGELTEWLVEVGALVEVDDPIASVETAKAVVEVVATSKGRVVELLVESGAEVTAGDVLARLETDG
jgi:pyruvate/2-oxoglutarate dehydrogenase complex dihydrolipoamide acyltransferase (E2) component